MLCESISPSAANLVCWGAASEAPAGLAMPIQGPPSCCRHPLKLNTGRQCHDRLPPRPTTVHARLSPSRNSSLTMTPGRWRAGRMSAITGFPGCRPQAAHVRATNNSSHTHPMAACRRGAVGCRPRGGAGGRGGASAAADDSAGGGPRGRGVRQRRRPDDAVRQRRWGRRRWQRARCCCRCASTKLLHPYR